MANLRLDKVDAENSNRAQKSYTASTSDTLSMTTAYQDVEWDTAIGAGTGQVWIDLANNPWLALIGKWTVGSGANLTLKILVSHDSDGTDAAETPIIPAPSGSGAVTAYQEEVTFPKASWGNGTVCKIALDCRINGYRYAKIQAKSDNASGTLVVKLGAGTGS